MGEQGLSPRVLALIVGAVVVVVDQVTKAWAVAALEEGPIELIDGFLQFRLTRNTGAAFSIFSGGGPVLGVIAVVVVVVIFIAVADTNYRLDAIALGLVLGGAVGNLIDRVVRGEGVFDGAVVDFIDFSFWPTFNVADSAITVGVLLLVVGSLFRR